MSQTSATRLKSTRHGTEAADECDSLVHEGDQDEGGGKVVAKEAGVAAIGDGVGDVAVDAVIQSLLSRGARRPGLEQSHKRMQPGGQIGGYSSSL